jgi:hypothetical protein
MLTRQCDGIHTIRESDARPSFRSALAIAAPTPLAYNLSPSATLLNQLAVFGWGRRGGLLRPAREFGH